MSGRKVEEHGGVSECGRFSKIRGGGLQNQRRSEEAGWYVRFSKIICLVSDSTWRKGFCGICVVNLLASVIFEVVPLY